ncbi:MAG TPA: hypothetical protein VKY27_04290 [Bacteriovoracaceae bacterium]|nr:hypothetical protein [Bacteriovoracaceae bacterium]
MKIFTFIFLILMSAQVLAEDIAVEDISIALDDMVKNNIISPVEAQRAKVKLRNSHKSFLTSTNRTPASVHTQVIDLSPSNDLSKVQMKHIEKEINHIFKRAIDK